MLYLKLALNYKIVQKDFLIFSFFFLLFVKFFFVSRIFCSFLFLFLSHSLPLFLFRFLRAGFILFFKFL